MATHDAAVIDRALEAFATVKREFEAEHGPLPGPVEVIVRLSTSTGWAEKPRSERTRRPVSLLTNRRGLRSVQPALGAEVRGALRGPPYPHSREATATVSRNVVALPESCRVRAYTVNQQPFARSCKRASGSSDESDSDRLRAAAHASPSTRQRGAPRARRAQAPCDEGETTAATVILTSPWEAESMAVAELLMSQHRWGHTRARRFLAGVPMTETKTIGSMTERQRQQPRRDARGADPRTRRCRPSAGARRRARLSAPRRAGSAGAPQRALVSRPRAESAARFGHADKDAAHIVWAAALLATGRLRDKPSVAAAQWSDSNVSAAQWSANSAAPGSDPAGQPGLRRERLQPRRPAQAPAQARLQGSCAHTLARGAELDTSLADAVAQAMKEWALEKGATHYTHWFQPLTG
jgi:hypothetical protein